MHSARPRWALSLGQAHARAGDLEAVSRLAEQVEEAARVSGYPGPAFSIAGKLHVLAGDAESALKALDRWAEVLNRPESTERAGLLKVRALMDIGRKDQASEMLGALEGDLNFRANREMAADLRRRMAAGGSPR